MITVLALAPLAFGSVHGFVWAFFAAFLGIVSVLYVLELARRGTALRVSLGALRWQIAIFGLFCSYLIVQILPLGLLIGPIPFAGAGGDMLSSNTISVAPDMTIVMLMRQLTYGLFFFLVLQVTANDGRRRLFLRVILGIVIFYACLAIVSLQSGDTVLGVPKTAYLGSATGPFVNRNSFATFLAFGAVIALAQIGRRVVDQGMRHPHDGIIPGNTSAIVLHGIGYVLLITVSVATQSKMGIFAALVGSFVVACVVMAKSIRSRIGIILLVLVGIAAIVSGLMLFGGNVLERVIDSRESAGTRLDLYAQVFELIARRPLTGFGAGSFELAFPLVHHLPLSVDVTWDKAHNTYLTLWSETGLIAGSLPMVLFGLVAIRLIRALRAGGSNWMPQTIALATLTLAAVHSLVDFSLEIQANTFVFLALIAAGLTTTFASDKG